MDGHSVAVRKKEEQFPTRTANGMHMIVFCAHVEA